MASDVVKAVIPAAGLGTRFLPATKAVPKEMLPVIDRPAIQYVVEEAVDAGLLDVLMITGRNKRPLEDHFDRNYELEDALVTKGSTDTLATVKASTELANVYYVRQGDPKGLGHAVLCAAPHVGDSPFAVLLGDDLIDARDHLLRRMIDVHRATGLSVVALLEVPREQIRLYGAAAVTEVPDRFALPPAAEQTSAEVVSVTGMVEKPDPDQAPSNYAVIGRYLLTPNVFEILRRTPPGRGGEIQLTDALAELAAAGELLGVVFRGRRYDTGDKLDYLRTIVALAAEREDLGADFTSWLRSFVASLD